MKTFTFEKEKYGFELLMDIHRLEADPNYLFEKDIHTTNFFEIFIFEQGIGTIGLNEQILNIKEKSIFFISPFQRKNCDVISAKIKGFHIVFQNDFLSNFFEDKLITYKMNFFHNVQHPPFLKLSSDEFELLKVALDEIANEVQNHQNDSLHIIRALLYFVLTKLNRLYAIAYNVSSETQFDSVVYKFREVLELNIRRSHKVEDYCKILNISRNKLNGIVKQFFGVTPKELIHHRLLQEIKVELIYTNKSISKIANDLKFSEPNNLTRFFKRMHGNTPLSYRSNISISRTFRY